MSKKKQSSFTTKADSDLRELIVVMNTEAGIRSHFDSVASLSGADVSPLNTILQKYNAVLVPLFDSEDRIAPTDNMNISMDSRTLSSMSTFYSINTTENKEEIVQELLNDPSVAGAYLKPAPEPPIYLGNDAEASSPEDLILPPATPDFVPRQIYLQAAPAGIDALYAHGLPGGKGDGIRIIDIEGAWRFTHEDLIANQGGVIGGTQSTAIGWRNHGTAVVGEFGGDENGKGIVGICPNANVRAISIFGDGMGSANAIRLAANSLSAGDIILIELHAPGPRFNFAGRNDQLGYIAMEFWPDNFAAIQYAVSRGVIVVEAAGNGAENFDDAIYNARPAGFPASWSNPFNLANPQSGAIIVGAGAPPPGTHGRNHGADRSRLGFSNFGSRVDVQGWGREVTTCGYGDLQGGPNEDFWYTDTFSGTSSASPIVVGALGCIQGRLRNRSRTLLNPASARNLLRTTGSPQQDEPGRPISQRIGNRPNLRQAFTNLGVAKSVTKEIVKEGKELAKERTKEFIKENRKELIKEGKELVKEHIKEFKEGKEFIKDFKEFEVKVRENIDVIDRINPTTDAESYVPSSDERISILEQTVADLQHFISINQRPDLLSNMFEDGNSY